MNGDAQLIMNKIVEIETRQEERHLDNKSDIKVIFKKLAKLDNLKCDVHTERMSGIDGKINWLWTVVIVVLIGGLVLGVWMKGM